MLLRRGTLGSTHPTHFTPPTPHTCWPQGCRRGEQRAAAPRVLGVVFADGEGVVPAARDVQDALAIDGRHDLREGEDSNAI